MKISKKFLSVILTLALVFTAVPFAFTASAETEDYYTYTVSDGEATITGCDTSISGDIVIPSTLGGYPVTSIGYSAFHNCRSLTSITIPDSVTSIGNYTFNGCFSLTSITIPDSVTSIGYSAFYNCRSLTSITIPDSVTSIGHYAFDVCISLTSITIPDSVTSIGHYAFDVCISLTSVTIPDSVTSIGNYTFNGCSSLTSITIPDSVTSIGNYTFSGCSSLTSITIPDSVTSIGNSAFKGCSSLTSVTIPDSVTSISDWSGHRINCSRGSYAHQFAINNDIPFVLFDATDEESLISDQYGKLLWLLDKRTATLTLSYIGEVPDFATTETLPYTEYAAYIDKVVIDEGAETISKSLFNGINLKCVIMPSTLESISDTTFSDKSYLTDVVMGCNVKTIGSSAFSKCSSLTSITIPDSVTSIGNSAFYGCSSLTSVTIPDSVTSIGSGTFSGCSSLTSITIPDSVTSIGNDAFCNCSSLKTVVLGKGLNSSCSYVFRSLELDTVVVDNMELDISNFNLYSTVTIYGYQGSKAQQYAEETGRTFIDISEYDPNAPTPNENCEHEYTEEVFEPTCTSAGYTKHTCSKCTYSYIDGFTPAVGHSYGDYIVDKEATCTESGKQHKVCADCHVTLNETIPAKGHSIVIEAAVEATCTESGLTEGKYCSSCGEVYAKQIEIPALGHSMGEWLTVVAPTETTEGVAVSVCKDCGYSEQKTIPATGSGSDECNHAYAVNVVAPTCTEEGHTTYYCVKCGDSYTDSITAATGHKYSEITIAATCTEKGTVIHLCACGDSYSERTPALGHTDENNDGICDVCSEQIVTPPAHVHSYVPSVTTAPTCKTVGERTFTCSCGESYTETIPATGHSDSDNDNICDSCGENLGDSSDNGSSNSTFDKFMAFINMILDWVRALFIKK